MEYEYWINVFTSYDGYYRGTLYRKHYNLPDGENTEHGAMFGVDVENETVDASKVIVGTVADDLFYQDLGMEIGNKEGLQSVFYDLIVALGEIEAIYQDILKKGYRAFPLRVMNVSANLLTEDGVFIVAENADNLVT